MERLFLFWLNLAIDCLPWCGWLITLAVIGLYAYRCRPQFPPISLPQRDSDNPDSWPKYRHSGRGGGE